MNRENIYACERKICYCIEYLDYKRLYHHIYYQMCYKKLINFNIKFL